MSREKACWKPTLARLGSPLLSVNPLEKCGSQLSFRFIRKLQWTELVHGDDSVPIYPVDQDLTDDQTEKSTEVRGYRPEGNGARRPAQ